MNVLERDNKLYISFLIPLWIQKLQCYFRQNSQRVVARMTQLTYGGTWDCDILIYISTIEIMSEFDFMIEIMMRHVFGLKDPWRSWKLKVFLWERKSSWGKNFEVYRLLEEERKHFLFHLITFSVSSYITTNISSVFTL